MTPAESVQLAHLNSVNALDYTCFWISLALEDLISLAQKVQSSNMLNVYFTNEEVQLNR